MDDQAVIDIERIKPDETLARVEADEPVEGYNHFIIGTYGDFVMIGGMAAKNQMSGDLYFDAKSLPTLIEMLADALAGKLQEPEKSRFEIDQGYFIYRSGNDDLSVGIRTVWTNLQRQPPTQLVIDNLRPYKYGALGKQTGMSIAMTIPTARKFLAELERIRERKGIS